MTGSIDVTFELLRRRAGADITLATWTDHYEPTANTAKAQVLAYDETAPMIDFTEGDQLVFRYSAPTAPTKAYTPNGDGALAGGQIPNITLPK